MKFVKLIAVAAAALGFVSCGSAPEVAEPEVPSVEALK